MVINCEYEIQQPVAERLILIISFLFFITNLDFVGDIPLPDLTR